MPEKKNTDFLKTLERMYKDSRILYEKGEYYNCCYLCGYILECALKYILYKYGKKQDGTAYTIDELKNIAHSTSKLNMQLDSWISMSGGIAAAYRLDSRGKCPYIFEGRGGYPHWDPRYRYGEHPKWDEKEYCEHYITESEYIFQFIAGIVTGGSAV